MKGGVSGRCLDEERDLGECACAAPACLCLGARASQASWPSTPGPKATWCCVSPGAARTWVLGQGWSSPGPNLTQACSTLQGKSIFIFLARWYWRSQFMGRLGTQLLAFPLAALFYGFSICCTSTLYIITIRKGMKTPSRVWSCGGAMPRAWGALALGLACVSVGSSEQALQGECRAHQGGR